MRAHTGAARHPARDGDAAARAADQRQRSLAAASDIIQTYGADSRIGRTAAVMLGSTETTFYVLAVYFGACGIRHSRWAIPAAIVADVTGFVTAAALVRCLWGT